MTLARVKPIEDLKCAQRPWAKVPLPTRTLIFGQIISSLAACLDKMYTTVTPWHKLSARPLKTGDTNSRLFQGETHVQNDPHSPPSADADRRPDARSIDFLFRPVGVCRNHAGARQGARLHPCWLCQ